MPQGYGRAIRRLSYSSPSPSYKLLLERGLLRLGGRVKKWENDGEKDWTDGSDESKGNVKNLDLLTLFLMLLLHKH